MVVKPPTNPQHPPKKRNHSLLLILAICFLAAAVLVWITITLFTKSTVNYAEEVAKPLEKALAEAGGVKVCSRGDAGRGPDNDQPNYESRFQLAMGKDDAVKLVGRVAEGGGFKLSRSDSPYESIEWYSDKITKENTYRELNDGKVVLNISTYSDTSEQVSSCLDGTLLLGDNTHTAVTLSIVMPPIKR